MQVELLQQAVSVMDAVARGSDAHLYLAARWQQRWVVVVLFGYRDGTMSLLYTCGALAGL